MAVPRISALLMLRSTISTVSAPATCLFRGSITNPAQLLCTLRGRRYRRLTQHLLPGGPLRPYPDRSCTGWTAPAFVGAFGNQGSSAYAAPRLRICAGQQGPRHQGDSGVARPSIDYEHRGLHGISAEPVQRLVAGVRTAVCSHLQFGACVPAAIGPTGDTIAKG